MLVNPIKHQAMLIGNTDHVFSFPVQKSITLFGITVNDRLCFDEQVSHIAFHTPKLKSNSMILWKEFLMLKEKAPLLQIIFAPSGQMIGHQRGTRTSPVVCFVLKLTFLSTTSTFVLEARCFTNGHQCNSAPLLDNLFLHTFEYDFMVKTMYQNITKATQFSNTFLYIDDLFSINNVDLKLYQRNLPVGIGT